MTQDDVWRGCRTYLHAVLDGCRCGYFGNDAVAHSKRLARAVSDAEDVLRLAETVEAARGFLLDGWAKERLDRIKAELERLADDIRKGRNS